MGNCCGGSTRSGGSAGVGRQQTFQSNNLNRQRSKREQRWVVTGQINLRDGNLKELPGSIAACESSAKLLDATNNKLTSLPPALAALHSLQRLILAKNLLVSLTHLSALINLKVLVVDSNRLTDLPVEIGSLKKLERLQCSNNALTSLPATLGNLPFLALLLCADNKIMALPPELGNASALVELDAADNYLQSIPESLGQLTRLQILRLDQNQLSVMPSSVLKGCSALHTLSLHQNPITAEVLQQTDGYRDFETRRRSKVDKQISGGAAHNLDEGVDRITH